MKPPIQFHKNYEENYWTLLTSFERTLIAQNKSSRTIGTYKENITLFGKYLVSQNIPLDVAYITRAHLEAFMMEQVQTHAANTAATRYRTLHVFFTWLEEEEEIRENPMQKMHSPKVVLQSPEVLTEDQLKKLLATCSGKDFYDRRDTAIIRLLIDTGMRRAEIANIKLEDIDWNLNVIRVIQKGGRMKVCPFGKKTAQALDRYIRIRRTHKNAQSPYLWVGHKNTFGKDGLYDVLQKRCEQAELPHIYPHLFRHTYAHMWLSNGGNEGDLMRLGGWSSRGTMARYGASAADSRAREAHRALSPGDKI